MNFKIIKIYAFLKIIKINIIIISKKNLKKMMNN